MPNQNFTTLIQMDLESYKDWVPKHAVYQQEQWKRLVWALRELKNCEEPGPINQLQHSLQMADRVYKDGGSDQLILCALCHDVGKVVGYQYHGEIAAEMLRPFVTDEHYSLVATHQDFECFHLGRLNAHLLYQRERYSSEPWYEAAIQFSLWDQASFDPDYNTPPLKEYLSLIESLCSAPNGRFSQHSGEQIVEGRSKP